MSRTTLHQTGTLAVALLLAGCGSAGPASLLPERDRSDVLAAIRATLAELEHPTLTACLSLVGPAPALDRTDPAPALLGDLAADRTVLAGSKCPPTYASPVRRVDSLGRPVDPPRPPGYEDPYVLEVALPDSARPTGAPIDVTVWQGTRFTGYACAPADNGGPFRCRVVRRGFA